MRHGCVQLYLLNSTAYLSSLRRASPVHVVSSHLLLPRVFIPAPLYFCSPPILHPSARRYETFLNRSVKFPILRSIGTREEDESLANFSCFLCARARISAGKLRRIALRLRRFIRGVWSFVLKQPVEDTGRWNRAPLCLPPGFCSRNGAAVKDGKRWKKGKHRSRQNFHPTGRNALIERFNETLE